MPKTYYAQIEFDAENDEQANEVFRKLINAGKIVAYNIPEISGNDDIGSEHD